MRLLTCLYHAVAVGCILFNFSDITRSEIVIKKSKFNDKQVNQTNNSSHSTAPIETNPQEANKHKKILANHDQSNRIDDFNDFLPYNLGKKLRKKFTGKKIIKKTRKKYERLKLKNQRKLKSTKKDKNIKHFKNKKEKKINKSQKKQLTKYQKNKSNESFKVKNLNATDSQHTEFVKIIKSPTFHKKFQNSVLFPKEKPIPTPLTNVTLSQIYTIVQPFVAQNLIKSMEKSEKQNLRNDRILKAGLSWLELKAKFIKKDKNREKLLHANKHVTDGFQATQGLTSNQNNDREKNHAKLSECLKICEQLCVDPETITCGCFHGFAVSKFDNTSCVDIDECSSSNGNCSHKCHNLHGSYQCSCPRGLRLDPTDHSRCVDVNECHLRHEHGPCHDRCINTFGGYRCSCDNLPGTRLGGDGHTCHIVDGCAFKKCSDRCINTPMGSYCLCAKGFQLGNDGETCQDINECDSERCHYGCLNTRGSFICIDKPKEMDQSNASVLHCSKYDIPITDGHIECHSGNLTNGTANETLPGTICTVVCPLPFFLDAQHSRICDLDGSWKGPNSGKCKVHEKPMIKCPKPVKKTLTGSKTSVIVKLKKPITNVRYDLDVKVYPKNAKRLVMVLSEGVHWLTFLAVHPFTQYYAKCQTKITIVKV